MQNKNQENLCNKIIQWFSNKNLYFIILYNIMFEKVKNILDKKDYYKFLDLSVWYIQRYNKIDFVKYRKDNKMSNTTFNDFRSRLSKNWIIKKINMKLFWNWRYINPLFIRKWSSNYTDLLTYFYDENKKFWIIIEDFID